MMVMDEEAPSGDNFEVDDDDIDELDDMENAFMDDNDKEVELLEEEIPKKEKKMKRVKKIKKNKIKKKIVIDLEGDKINEAENLPNKDIQSTTLQHEVTQDTKKGENLEKINDSEDQSETVGSQKTRIQSNLKKREGEEETVIKRMKRRRKLDKNGNPVQIKQQEVAGVVAIDGVENDMEQEETVQDMEKDPKKAAAINPVTGKTLESLEGQKATEGGEEVPVEEEDSAEEGSLDAEERKKKIEKEKGELGIYVPSNIEDSDDEETKKKMRSRKSVDIGVTETLKKKKPKTTGLEIDKIQVKKDSNNNTPLGSPRIAKSQRKMETFVKAEPMKFKTEVKSRIKQLQEQYMWEKQDKIIDLELEIAPRVTEMSDEEEEVQKKAQEEEDEYETIVNVTSKTIEEDVEDDEDQVVKKEKKSNKGLKKLKHTVRMLQMMRKKPSVAVDAYEIDKPQHDLIKKVREAITLVTQGEDVDLQKVVKDHVEETGMKIDLNKFGETFRQITDGMEGIIQKKEDNGSGGQQIQKEAKEQVADIIEEAAISKGVNILAGNVPVATVGNFMSNQVNPVKSQGNQGAEEYVEEGEDIDVVNSPFYEYFEEDEEVEGEWEYVDVPIKVPKKSYEVVEEYSEDIDGPKITTNTTTTNETVTPGLQQQGQLENFPDSQQKEIEESETEEESSYEWVTDEEENEDKSASTGPKVPKINLTDAKPSKQKLNDGQENEEEVKTERIQFGSSNSSNRAEFIKGQKKKDFTTIQINQTDKISDPSQFGRASQISLHNKHQGPGSGFRKNEVDIMKTYLLENREVTNPTVKIVEIESKIFKNQDRLGFQQLSSKEQIIAAAIFPAKIIGMLTIPPTSRKDANPFRMITWPFLGTLFTIYVLSYGYVLMSIISIGAALVAAVLMQVLCLLLFKDSARVDSIAYQAVRCVGVLISVCWMWFLGDVLVSIIQLSGTVFGYRADFFMLGGFSFLLWLPLFLSFSKVMSLLRRMPGLSVAVFSCYLQIGLSFTLQGILHGTQKFMLFPLSQDLSAIHLAVYMGLTILVSVVTIGGVVANKLKYSVVLGYFLVIAFGIGVVFTQLSGVIYGLTGAGKSSSSK